MTTAKVASIDIANTLEYAVWLFDTLEPRDCVICKDNQWYLWTSFETLVPTDDPDYDTEYCHDYDERKDSSLYLDSSFGKIIGVQFDNSRLYLWVEG